MRIEKTYRQLEGIEEVNIYDITESELFQQVPKEFEVPFTPFEKTLKHLSNDLDIFVPYDDGEDFIVHRLGLSALIRGHIEQNDVAGRLLSKTSPGFYKVLKEPFQEVYKTHETKKMRFYYHFHEKLARFSNVKIIYDMDRIVLISDHRDNRGTNLHVSDDEGFDEKANLIEYFSLTGSYYKINDRYTWTQGIYNIINRTREENDEYYNIVFDLVIPEDKPIIEKMLKVMDQKRSNYESVIRIKTNDGTLKYIEVSLYSKFDEYGNLINRYGLIKDVSTDSSRKMTRPVDFLLKGFKNNKNLALLIEPLNPKQYEFSEGFYQLIEIEPEDYRHSREVVDNIVEEDVQCKLKELIDGEVDDIDVAFTYDVGGDPNHQKMCELYIERFEFNSETHSIGFLTDVTHEKIKQHELIEANEHQKILIKEVHHRVKNNLQVLNSFLNLEKRAYKNKPNIIIDHMQSRLSSLAILHEKTYNTTDFKNINLKEYIVDQDSQLRGLIGLRDGIEFVSEVDEDINLTIEVITPLLLVIDELTMNAIKHAFPDKSVPNKKIFKQITKLDNSTGQLILKDNGVGIDDPTKITKNLGCEIIKNLTKQLDGKIELIQHEHGTGYKLTFPLDMEHTIEG
ncbi:histidine kinase dimerization/phosphoacceptor domain -containing protein [Methanobrevibacter sp.]|uniref:PAS domain-containing sensor histidine kinase n=1 Tax=Methanobrevibacter sp. TaxID=66852 RepID=UPI0025D4B3B6|nr:histidine kinase dimerization/phosphoacceptor domain -containing protein [Methanobrevibacter sp.]MBQ2832607.1 PAS domain-containing protein [Methanobrevibacter sp.]